MSIFRKPTSCEEAAAHTLRYLPIQRVATELNLTSRALRHWEDRGLIESERDPESGWRCYSPAMVARIRLITGLRTLNISLASVGEIVADPTRETSLRVLRQALALWNEQALQYRQQIRDLERLITDLESRTPSANVEDSVTHALQNPSPTDPKEVRMSMSNETAGFESVRIVSLPSMRTAAHEVVAAEPETKALAPLLTWASERKLEGTMRIFGYNTTPYKPGDTEYGWGSCISVPTDVPIPEPFQEKMLPGGVYASLNSTSEIYDSWQHLVKELRSHEHWQSDSSRPCLEEHIPSPDKSGVVGEYHLTLLMPVKEE